MTAPPLDGNAPWDRQWRVPKPDDFVSGLYKLHQLAAFDLLRAPGVRLTNWEASLLQTVAYQARSLSDLQRYWLDRIEREHARRAA